MRNDSSYKSFTSLLELELSVSNITLDWEVPCAILYTLATTGLPKGVVHTYSSLSWSVSSTIENYGYHQNSIAAIFGPLCHGDAFAARLLPMLAVGATGVMTRTFDLLVWIEALRTHPVKILVNRPTLLQASL